jgi:PAS domain S-box-containing protein
MAAPDETPESAAKQVSELFDSMELQKAMESEEFKYVLDHVPIGIAVSRDTRGEQRIIYANRVFEELTGRAFAQIAGQPWSVLDVMTAEDDPQLTFSRALQKWEDFVGTFRLDDPKPVLVEAYAGIIDTLEGAENYRIVAIIDVTTRERAQREEFARQLRDKDLLLRELQHRVKNNLQLITALIRLDARNQRHGDKVNLDRLAGRIESLQLLYADISLDGWGQTVDLGHYLSQIASAVMRTYAVDGIKLDLKVEYAPVSINVAMPVGLLVNELLTNAFKYAFTARAGGTLTVRCLHEAEDRYRIVVGDDGVGLPEGVTWPVEGKLGALVLQSLKENAQTEFEVESERGKGTRTIIRFVHKPPAHKPN